MKEKDKIENIENNILNEESILKKEKQKAEATEKDIAKTEKVIDKEARKISEPEEKNNNTAIFIVFGIAILIILICVIAVFLRYNSNNFKYAGMEFNKNYMGDITFYTAKVPAIDAYGNIQLYKEIDFRNDPRKLRDVTVDVNGSIKFIKNNMVYVSYGEMEQCGNNGLAATNLGIFLSTTNLNYKGALDDPDYINSTAIPYVNCQTHPNNTVILIKSGNETKIEKTSDNCYEIVFKDCEMLKATEKFEVIILDQYMKEITKK
jgi:predicted nucleic acid-binding Zn ribbon protein